MSGDNWWDLMTTLYLIALNDKNNSAKAINNLLQKDYPDEIKQALEMFKKGLDEK